MKNLCVYTLPLVGGILAPQAMPSAVASTSEVSDSETLTEDQFFQGFLKNLEAYRFQRNFKELAGHSFSVG